MSSTSPAATFDHVAVRVPAEVLEAELRFFGAALAPLGIAEQFRVRPLVAALGRSPHKPDFWVSALDAEHAEVRGPVTQAHVAFAASGREQVDAFHKAGVASGGTDHGAPGIRDQYHAGYYGAFLVSPAGHNIEVVYHDMSWMEGKQ